jgi:hypothetical protein
MHVTYQEFTDAFKIVSAKHSLDRTLARGFVDRLEALHTANKIKKSFERERFVTLIRLALNESKINKPDERKHYAALAGHVFGKRGNYVRQINTGKPRIKGSRPSAVAPPTIEVNERGQLGWKI